MTPDGPDATAEGFIEQGGVTWVGARPSTRFPIWTRGNAGEVYPNVVLPLTYSTGFAAGERAMRAAALHTGVATTRDFAEGPDVAIASGAFGGYAYLNLSFNRVLTLRVPGGRVEDVDRVFMGDADPPPHETQRGDRSLVAGWRGLRHLIRTLRTTELPQLEADKERVRELRDRFADPGGADDAELRAAIDELSPFFEDLFETHLVVSGQAGVAMSVLTRICEDRLENPALALRLLGGLGDVESAAPAAALFDLGQLVAADIELTAAFDHGIATVEDAVRELDTPAARRFLDAFADFLDRFGSRGPNEWDFAAHTWGTDHALALALIDRMRVADPGHDPAAQHERLAREREQLAAETRARLRGPSRWLFDRALRAATVFSQGRERSKTTIVAGIHVSRLAARELARRTVRRGAASEDDMWFVTIDELDAYVAAPATFAGEIAARRRTHERLREHEPPFFFVGELPSIDTWTRRDRSLGRLGVGDVVQGIGGCPGVARGRARIVLDPADPGQLGPGDVLVAPLTDPSWTPLFVPAEAIVVDVGAVMSHAVIVSRELGLPCVVSASDATRTIPEGAMIEVDGDAGTVTVLDVP